MSRHKGNTLQLSFLGTNGPPSVLYKRQKEKGRNNAQAGAEVIESSAHVVIRGSTAIPASESWDVQSQEESEERKKKIITHLVGR